MTPADSGAGELLRGDELLQSSVQPPHRPSLPVPAWLGTPAPVGKDAAVRHHHPQPGASLGGATTRGVNRREV